MKNVKNIKSVCQIFFLVKNFNLNVTEVQDSDFKNAFHGIFNFTVGILGIILKIVPQWSAALMDFLDMRRDVQEIFRGTPHDKQVMMFSATLSKETREICKKFMQDVNINFHYNNSKSSFPSSCHVPPIFGIDKTLVGSLDMVHVTSWYSPSSTNRKMRYVISARAVARKIVRHIILWYYHSEDPYPHGIITSGDHFRSWFIETRVATSGIDDEMSDNPPLQLPPLWNCSSLNQFAQHLSYYAKLEMWNWF